MTRRLTIVPSLLSLPPDAVFMENDPAPDPIWATFDKSIKDANRKGSGDIDWIIVGGYSFCTDGRVLFDGVEVPQIEADAARDMLRRRMYGEEPG